MAFVGNNGVNRWDFLGLVDILMKLTRTGKNANDTTGKLEACPTDEKIKECCGCANVDTIELKVGKFKRRSNGKTKGFPIDEDTNKVVINDPSRTGTLQIMSQINKNLAAAGRPPVGVLADLDNRNFHIQGVDNFGGICIHAGTSANSSDGCVIVGKETEEGTIVNPDANGADTVPGSIFQPGSSQEAMLELLELYDCVEEKLDKKPTIKIIISNNF